MDRLIPLLSFSAAYSLLALGNLAINTPPPALHSKKKWDFLGQHISFVHSIMSIILSGYVYILEGGIHYNSPTNTYHILVMSHTLGYFIYDMIYAEIFQVHDWAMRTHHLCVLFGGIIMLFENTGGSIATICILITEGSNPCMMLRKILKTKGLEKTGYYQVIELVFAVSFVFYRSVLTTFVNYNVWVSPLPLVTKLGVSITYGLGFFWIYVIVTIAAKKLIESQEVLKAIERVSGFISKMKIFFAIGTFVWAILVPFYLTSILRTEYLNFVVRGFIVF